jgi:hypothetical protein
VACAVADLRSISGEREAMMKRLGEKGAKMCIVLAHKHGKMQQEAGEKRVEISLVGVLTAS